MGSFVPARACPRSGAIDRLFLRWAGPDRARTLDFMVEMVETAAILNQAGERSLVILDEIGRRHRHLRRALDRPGPPSSTCTRPTGAVRCSPPIFTS